VHKEPQRRVGKESGREFVTAKLRCESGSDTVWCNVMAFQEAAAQALASLRAGDACSILGTMKVSTYTRKTAKPEPPSMSLRTKPSPCASLARDAARG
jgi:single-stranded DNA-binding protein